MFDRLEIFQMAQALARHSSARQAEIAANVANADTPGYRAGDVAPFSQVYDGDRQGSPMLSTRPGHVSAGPNGPPHAPRVEIAAAAAPNGNTVSLEAEMVRAVEVRHAHDTALSVYDTARSILRTSLGRGR